MGLPNINTQWLRSPCFHAIIITLGLPIIGIVVWSGARALNSILNQQNCPNVTSMAQIILSLLTLGPIIWAILRYQSVAENQKKAKHYQAWQAISNAQGKPGSGGRRTALEDLHKDGVTLVGVDLSGGAYLAHLNLPGANLTEVNFQESTLAVSNLQKANLSDAILQKANLVRANLQKANLADANLRGANLVLANLQGANLTGAKLQGACLTEANLRGAYLERANLLNSRDLTREQILSTRDWRGAVLPLSFKYLELPEFTLEEELDRLGRTWKPNRYSKSQ